MAETPVNKMPILDLPPGVLNPVLDPAKRDIGSKTIDYDSETGFSALNRSVASTFTQEKLKNAGPLNGILLRIEDDDKAPGTALDKALMMGGVSQYKLKKYRVRVPELHFGLPVPGDLLAAQQAYKSGKSSPTDNLNKANKIIDMYPVFQAIDTGVAEESVKPGDLVKVQIRDKGSLDGFTYLGPVKSDRPTMAAIIAALKAWLEACMNAAPGGTPPVGDPMGEDAAEQPLLTRARDANIEVLDTRALETYAPPAEPVVGGIVMDPEIFAGWGSPGAADWIKTLDAKSLLSGKLYPTQVGHVEPPRGISTTSTSNFQRGKEYEYYLYERQLQYANTLRTYWTIGDFKLLTQLAALQYGQTDPERTFIAQTTWGAMFQESQYRPVGIQGNSPQAARDDGYGMGQMIGKRFSSEKDLKEGKKFIAWQHHDLFDPAFGIRTNVISMARLWRRKAVNGRVADIEIGKWWAGGTPEVLYKAERKSKQVLEYGPNIWSIGAMWGNNQTPALVEQARQKEADRPLPLYITYEQWQRGVPQSTSINNRPHTENEIRELIVENYGLKKMGDDGVPRDLTPEEFTAVETEDLEALEESEGPELTGSEEQVEPPSVEDATKAVEEAKTAVDTATQELAALQETGNIGVDGEFETPEQTAARTKLETAKEALIAAEEILAAAQGADAPPSPDNPSAASQSPGLGPLAGLPCPGGGAVLDDGGPLTLAKVQARRTSARSAAKPAPHNNNLPNSDGVTRDLYDQHIAKQKANAFTAFNASPALLQTAGNHKGKENIILGGKEVATPGMKVIRYDGTMEDEGFPKKVGELDSATGVINLAGKAWFTIPEPAWGPDARDRRALVKTRGGTNEMWYRKPSQITHITLHHGGNKTLEFKPGRGIPITFATKGYMGHFAIGADGQIYQICDAAIGTMHAGGGGLDPKTGPNPFSIAIDYLVGVNQKAHRGTSYKNVGAIDQIAGKLHLRKCNEGTKWNHPVSVYAGTRAMHEATDKLIEVLRKETSIKNRIAAVDARLDRAGMLASNIQSHYHLQDDRTDGMSYIFYAMAFGKGSQIKTGANF